MTDDTREHEGGDPIDPVDRTDTPSPPPPPPVTPPPVARRPVLCASCRYDISDQPVGGRCPECGTPIMQSGQPQQTQGKAVASLVLGICSIPGCFMYGIPGIVCGILAIVYAKKAEVAIQLGEAPVTSQGFAKAGRTCGWIGLILSILYLGFFILYILFFVVVAAGGGF